MFKEQGHRGRPHRPLYQDDEAQRAEAHRVAYVGITHAMERRYWFAKKKDGGVFERIPLNRAFARKVDAAGRF